MLEGRGTSMSPEDVEYCNSLGLSPGFTAQQSALHSSMSLCLICSFSFLQNNMRKASQPLRITNEVSVLNIMSMRFWKMQQFKEIYRFWVPFHFGAPYIGPIMVLSSPASPIYFLACGMWSSCLQNL